MTKYYDFKRYLSTGIRIFILIVILLLYSSWNARRKVKAYNNWLIFSFHDCLIKLFMNIIVVGFCLVRLYVYSSDALSFPL